MVYDYTHNILYLDIDGLVQERRNSIANAMELRLSCTNPSTWDFVIGLVATYSKTLSTPAYMSDQGYVLDQNYNTYACDV